MEWVDNIFLCMEQFYGDRWNDLYPDDKMLLSKKIVWQSSLHGLKYDEIKETLRLLRRAAKDPHAKPPHALQFWQYAKGHSEPYIDYTPKPIVQNKEIARAHLDEIKRKLGMKVDNPVLHVEHGGDHEPHESV